jgi:ABC-type nitrate/sulfonate/bicarbonate transport system substrate-binding protein
MADLEKTRIKVGFIPIIDCAAIVLAEELGAYERQGLEVEIRREVSWANVRDKLALGVLDASHILAPLPLALTLGIDSVSVPMINAMTLQVNGNGLTLSAKLWHEMEEVAPELAGAGTPLDARAIAAVVARRKAAGAAPIVLASVFPYSVQNYMLRLWLSSGGVDPDRDVCLTVVPPPHTVAYMSGGVIDGYCVGEPWNQRAQALGIGRIALTGPDIWRGMPEKVLGTTEAWANRHPNTLLALVKALIEACLWLDEPANRAEAARLLSSPRYLNTPAEVISRTLELPGFHVFQRDAANFPWRSHADWFLAQMVLWKQASPDIDIKGTADRVYRTDIYRAAAREMGVACPDIDRLPPGGHGEPVVPRRGDRPSTKADAACGSN